MIIFKHITSKKMKKSIHIAQHVWFWTRPLVAGPMTILIPFAAKFLSLSRLLAGFDCVSSIMRPTLVFELVFEKYAFTSLIATFRAAAWDHQSL